MSAVVDPYAEVCPDGCCVVVSDPTLERVGDVFERPMFEVIGDSGGGDSARWPSPHPWHDLDET